MYRAQNSPAPTKQLMHPRFDLAPLSTVRSISFASRNANYYPQYFARQRHPTNSMCGKQSSRIEFEQSEFGIRSDPLLDHESGKRDEREILIL